MRTPTALENILAAATAVILIGSQIPGSDGTGPVLTAAVSLMGGSHAASSDTAMTRVTVTAPSKPDVALGALASVVGPLSHPDALHDAFVSYFAFKSEHPEKVRKPYLYFVDYGLPSTSPRGYLFDMNLLKVVEGPFTVAHGRGSAGKDGIPTRFSNDYGSYATSLGLYLAKDTYAFHGKASGRSYGSVGLKLEGMSGDYNDNALARRVVAHGAPYVTPTKSGRSEGCPAMEQARAARILPKLANGGLVFLFAPDPNWMSKDPWIAQADATDAVLGE